MFFSSKRASVTFGLLVGMFLAALEATVVGTAMPTVVSSLGGLEIYSWVFSAYLLTSTVTVPVWGKVSDLYGRRPLYLASIGFFLLGSVLSGQAQSMGQLIIFRAIQGLGAGGLMPLGMTIVAELYTPVERVKIQGYFSGVWGLASLLGPLVGGFLTDQLSWRWVFYLNVPFGISAGAIVWTQLAENLENVKKHRLDLVGIAAFTTSVSMFMILLVRSETSFNFTDPITLLLLAGSAVSMLIFVALERRAEEPLIPVELFRNRVFTGATVNAFLAGASIFGMITFIPLFVQGVQGTGATEAGTVLTPLLLGWVLFSTMGARLLLRFTFRQVMIVGMLLMVTGYLLLDTMTAETGRLIVLRNAALLGAGMGLTMITGVIAVQDTVARSQLGIATSTSQFFRSIGGALGVTIMGTVLTQRMNVQLAMASAHDGIRELAQHPDAFLQPSTRASLSPEMIHAFQQVLAGALHWVFITGTFICIVGLVCVRLMPPTRLSGPHRTDVQEIA